jgi:hypothetical protein
MQLVSLTEQQKQRFFYLLCAVVAAVMFFTSEQEDPGVIAAAVVLALVSLYPLYFWLLGYSHGLPLWPVFVMMNGVTAALPMVQAPETLDVYSPGEIVTAGMTYVGFVLIGTIAWLSLTSRAPAPPKRIFTISNARSIPIMLAFVASGIFYYYNQFSGWIPLPGNTSQIARGVCLSLNTMGIFVLAFYLGRGLLTKWQGVALILLTIWTIAIISVGLILAVAMVPLAMVFLGYTLGSGKVPWKSLAATFVVLSILHPGKYMMRDVYWTSGGGENNIYNLPGWYAEWAGYGLQELGGVTGVLTGPKEESEVTGVFERAGNIHMLLRVQKMSPEEVPFLEGITYEGIPALLLPRFVYREKGLAHNANIMLTVNYGVQNIDQATSGTSIQWGLITEAYANYGYVGVAGLAVFLALFYAYFSRLTVGVPLISLRFVLGLLVMGAAVRADTMALFITSQFQAIVGVSVAALFLMRRQLNPLVVDGGEGWLPEAEVGGRRSEDGDRRSEVGGRRPEVGGQRSKVGGRKAEGVGRMPARLAPWMPRSMQKKMARLQRAEDGDQRPEDGGQSSEVSRSEAETGRTSDQRPQVGVLFGGRIRPRQVAVPFQNYRRYRRS